VATITGYLRKKGAIYRLWPDFPVRPLIDRSVSTVKADAAGRSYDASGADVIWGVIDSGIDATHPHFQDYQTLTSPDVAKLHRDFTVPDPEKGGRPLEDGYGHGTHVAGIIAGGLTEKSKARPLKVFEKSFDVDPSGIKIGSVSYEERKVTPLRERMRGVAPM
jgi:subtilisin family serine protease